VLITDAMQSIKHDDSDDAANSRRHLVDFAYQMDPDLATSLASALDDDEARRSARESLAYQKLKTQLREANEPTDTEVDRDHADYSNAAWDLLGHLNAGRVEPRDVSETLKFVRLAGELSLNESFPMLSWVIQNAITKRAHADEAKRLLRDMFEATMSASEMSAALVSRASGKSSNLSSAFSTKRDDSLIIRAEQRDKAIDYVRTWLRTNAHEYLTICDPYFGPKDLEILQLVLSSVPNLHVTIVTSRKQQEQEKVEWPWDEYYAKYWRKHFSDQAPPKTEIVVVGGRTGDLPIHDRWWVTKNKGLRFGSSFSGLGKSRDSEVSELDSSETEERLQLTQMYITRQIREHLGEKLTYQSSSCNRAGGTLCYAQLIHERNEHVLPHPRRVNPGTGITRGDGPW
jgi:hypothetical protein